jgi:hypothetical protein
MKWRSLGGWQRIWGYKIPERTFRDNLRQLLEREFLYESLV